MSDLFYLLPGYAQRKANSDIVAHVTDAREVIDTNIKDNHPLIRNR